MALLKSFEGDADGVHASLLVNEMCEEADVSTIGGAMKEVGNGWTDGLPSVSRPVLRIWRLRQSFTGRSQAAMDLLQLYQAPYLAQLSSEGIEYKGLKRLLLLS